MKCQILHESKGRMRVRMLQYRMTLKQADILEYYLKKQDGVLDVKVNERTSDAIILFDTDRDTIICMLSHFHYEENEDIVPDHTGRELSREYEDKVIYHTLKRTITRICLPLPVRSAISFMKCWKFIVPGVQALLKGNIEVSVLDATTIVVSMLRGDFDTAGDLMFLLGLSEILEEWTHKKSVDDLARSMSLNVDKAWKVLNDGTTVLMPVSELVKGDHFLVRTSNMIPLDGFVVEGNVEVNQASMTGESLPVSKDAGKPVFAGTVVEDGECVIEVSCESGSGRYDRIVNMIEESEKMKSDFENRSTALADKLVPYSLIGTVLAYAFTRNVNKALSILMVDFSCALKLSIPIAVLSAMRQASNMGIVIKGGKYMELVSKADIVVFDKTGTLTVSSPTVKDIVTFGGNDKKEMLKLAACLEEHYPHSIANAVVKAAEEEGLVHEEKHSKVEYVVAHGIVSSINGQKVLIGSHHFLFEDEKCVVPEEELETFNSIPDEYSHLYMAIGNRLVAVILIEDPIRKESKQLVQSLHEYGLRNLVMMTGDSERTARAVANKVGMDAYYSEVLPEDKASFVRKEKKNGNTVIMIGDGINDALALSEADVAIAISNGAEITREIADVTIPAEDITKIASLRNLSTKLESRIEGNYQKIMFINSTLIVLGLLGILPPSSTAYLHNFSTLALSAYSMSDMKIS